MIFFLLALGGVLANPIDGGVGTPCPSDCWEWDATKGECILKSPNTCFTLTCSATEMTLTFQSSLFDVEDDAQDFPFGNSTHSPTFVNGTSQWAKTCPLGDCGHVVTATAINGTNEMHFAYTVATDMSKITVATNSTNATTLDVWTAPVNSQITFTCSYPSVVDVESANFTVKGATATGQASTIGDLSGGFKLGIYVDQNYTTLANVSNLFIGQPAYGEVEWTVSTASAAVDYVVNECKVVHTDANSDTHEVAVISSQCFSSALGAEAISSTRRNDSRFNFKFTSFTVGGSNTIEMQAKMVCSLTVCLKSDANACKAPTSCPTTLGYAYQQGTYA